MLALTRKPGQSIRIGDDVIVKVVSSKPGGVRIAIEAPKQIPIQRTELLGNKQERQS